MDRNLLSKCRQLFQALSRRQLVLDCDRVPHRFQQLPLKKILNWLLVEASVVAKPGKAWGWPTHLQIEPSARCNLHCAICPVPTGMHRPTGFMDFQVFQKLLDEIGAYALLILLYDWGEPFLNPRIYEMIAYAKERGIKLVSSTNGHIFTQVDQADRLIRSGLDTLVVAMDGATQETYAQYRQGGELDSVKEGIRTLVARKRALNSPTPLINLRFIVMRHNEREISLLPGLARSLGVDALTLKTLNPDAADKYGDNRASPEENYGEFLPLDPRYHRFRYTSSGRRLRQSRNPCKHLWNNPAIHWDGAVCPCTFDYEERYLLGRLGTDTFKDIWQGAAYQRLRRQFRRNWEGVPLCGDCTYAYLGGNCNRETVGHALFFPQSSPVGAKL